MTGYPHDNNEAEYEALVVGLDLAKVAGAENMIVHCDSQVITIQIMATTSAEMKG